MSNINIEDMDDSQFESFSHQFEVSQAKGKQTTRRKPTLVRSEEAILAQEELDEDLGRDELRGGTVTSRVVDHSVQNNEDIFKPMPKQPSKSIFQERAEEKSRDVATRKKNRATNKAFAESMRRQNEANIDDW